MAGDLILLNFPLKFVPEREAEEQRLAGGGQLYPGAGWSGDGVRPHASQHRGRHPQNRADHQEYSGAVASCSGEQTWQVRMWKELYQFRICFFFCFFLIFPHFKPEVPLTLMNMILLCLVACVSYHFPFRSAIFTLPPSFYFTLLRCYDVPVSRCPRPSPPCEQTMWAWRCASAQAQPRMLQHSGALGREGPPSPPAAQPPVPWPHLLVLWPLSLPPRHSFVFLSLTQPLFFFRLSC